MSMSATPTFRKAQMPPEFLWGAATASYQIEGATKEDGRSESIWDRFCATPGKVKNGDTGDVACDHYHRYREDVALMKELGLNAYRFSIAWPRILPDGLGSVNQAGLDFYQRLVDELLAAGIRPFVTLYHWDLPQVLQERWGGWAGRDTANAFVEYANVVTRALGDRVKDWITLNEPWVSSILGYWWGIHAPGWHDQQVGLQAAHNLLLAHGRAVPVIRSNSPQAQVGITLNLTPVYPFSDSPADTAQARMADGGLNRWFLDPLFTGKYPTDMWEAFGTQVPSIQDGDLAAISVPVDFLGVNYYSPHIAKADPTGKNPLGEIVRREGVERTAMDWEVDPVGLYDLLTRLNRDYTPATLYITENGAAFEDTVAPDGAIHDDRRLAYLDAHFTQAARAIETGVPLKGYFVWSLTDNFEWAEGYAMRFGIVYVDYATQQRTLKDSARWYARILKG